MKIRFFAVPVLDSAAVEQEVNAFLSSHRVLSLDKHLLEADGIPVWALAVTYLEPGSPKAQPAKGRIDYREILPAKEFAVYAQLRRLRKETSEREGVPVYSLFTNEQLAKMVQQKVRSVQDLEALEGVGPIRIAKYGAAFLKILVGGNFGEEPGTSG